MALEVIQKPEGKFLMSKEPMYLHVASDAFVSGAGAFASFSTRFVGPADGDWVDIGLAYPGGSETIRFDWKTAGTETAPTDLTVLPTGMDRVNWTDMYVLPVIKSHPTISKHFNVERSGTGYALRFTAKNTGPDYSMSFAHSGYAFGPENASAGVAADVNENMKVALRINVNDAWRGNKWYQSKWKVFDLLPRVDFLDLVGGELKLDVGPLVDAMLSANAEYPDGYVTSTVAMDARKAYLEVAEYDTGAAEPMANPATLVRLPYLMRGARRTTEWATTYDSVMVDGTQRVITNLPVKRYFQQGMSDVLHTHFKTGRTVVKMRRWGLYNTVAEADANFVTLSATEDGELLRINTTPLLAGEWRRVILFTVESGEEVVWADYEVTADTDVGFQLRYVNAYGLQENLWCMAERIPALESSGARLKVGRNFGELADLGTMRSYGQALVPTIKASTRALMPTEAVKHLDMLVSRQMWVRLQMDGKWIPCSVLPGSVQLPTDNFSGNYVGRVSFDLVLNEEAGWSDASGTGL